jgi:hypothetical protein
LKEVAYGTAVPSSSKIVDKLLSILMTFAYEVQILAVQSLIELFRIYVPEIPFSEAQKIVFISSSSDFFPFFLAVFYQVFFRKIQNLIPILQDLKHPFYQDVFNILQQLTEMKAFILILDLRDEYIFPDIVKWILQSVKFRNPSFSFTLFTAHFDTVQRIILLSTSSFSLSCLHLLRPPMIFRLQFLLLS